MDPFKVLNNFQIALIVENLNREDVVRLQLVNRGWRKTLNCNFICKAAFLHHFSWTQEVADYHRLAMEETEQGDLERPYYEPPNGNEHENSDEPEGVLDGEDETDLVSRFDFTAAFRGALRQRISLRNGTPQRVERFFLDTQDTVGTPINSWNGTPQRAERFFLEKHTRDAAGTPTNETVWAVSESSEPCFVAWVTDGVLRITHPNRRVVRVLLPSSTLTNRFYLQPEFKSGIRRLEALELKIMAGVVVLRGNGDIFDWTTRNRWVSSIFLAFSYTGVLLWEHLVPHLILPSGTLDTIGPNHFNLVNRGGDYALVYLSRHGEFDRDSSVSVHWVNLHTGVRLSENYLSLGLLASQRHGPFSPLNWLWRDVQFSKDGRYLATVTLKEETKSTEARSKGATDVVVPRGAHHQLSFNLFLNKIQGRVYRVYVHDMKTGKLIMNHELERPSEPNGGNIKLEFSPKISFCCAENILHAIEETYAYMTHDVPSVEKATIESYGWTIDLKPKTGTTTSEQIKRKLYTSQLIDEECAPAGFKGPYRVETFIPNDGVSIIRYNNQINEMRFDVGCYLSGADEIDRDGVEQATSLMWERNNVLECPASGLVWRLPTMEFCPTSGKWSDALLINERYLGIAPGHPLTLKLTLLDFGSD